MKQYIIDAFTDELFKGNPAGVCVMDEWISDYLMANIAKENNLSETAFVVKENDVYHIRWFTPGGEIDFCGHATLAASYILFRFYCSNIDHIHLVGQIGSLYISRNEDWIEMEFPPYNLHPIEITALMEEAIGIRPKEAYQDRDVLLIVDDEETVKNIKVDLNKLEKLDGACVAVSAKGKKYDCVSRVFAPRLKIDEDPVTGSTHCMIAPYWASKLNKNELIAYQASSRTGVLKIKIDNQRVFISGKAVLYSVGDILG